MPNLIWKRIMDVQGSPCQGCENYEICGLHELACEQFQTYVDKGELELILPKKPTREIFMEIYFEEELEGEF